jgi:hypothetical protein
MALTKLATKFKIVSKDKNNYRDKFFNTVFKDILYGHQQYGSSFSYSRFQRHASLAFNYDRMIAESLINTNDSNNNFKVSYFQFFCL